MCIRDSNTTGRVDGKAVAIVVEQLVADRVVGSIRVESSDPVSYTHLRAHETVLDLVCRLLLEKKKDHTTHASHYTLYQLTHTYVT
mgnify:CR=1 FL=1